MSRPKIYYNIPWSSEKNLGKAYNEFAALVPEDGWICFMDADTMPTTPFYGKQIEDIIAANPEVEAFTCATNRVACKWQIAKGSDWYNDDMRYQHIFGANQFAKYGCAVEDVTDKKQRMSGHFLCIKKSLWTVIGGVAEGGMLGIDNDLHRRIQESGHKLYIAPGLYLYHWYRGGNKAYTLHLK